jgi:cell fate regulator YaaT (PSP1 superfamily)
MRKRIVLLYLVDRLQTSDNRAARYQNLAINQAKLSGQCGRLKCCLNYELDVYMEALEGFPTNVDILRYANGQLKLIKTDILKS